MRVPQSGAWKSSTRDTQPCLYDLCRGYVLQPRADDALTRSYTTNSCCRSTRSSRPSFARTARVVFIDTDGFVEPLIPWFLEGRHRGHPAAGAHGGRGCEPHHGRTIPHLFMVGGYDKTVMHKGEAAMRAEFERILPAIRSGALPPRRGSPDPAGRDAWKTMPSLCAC